METSPTSSIARDELFPKSFPRTPPYTPNAIRQHFQRSGSPASVQSIHPSETVSPTKQKEQPSVQDGVHIEELKEGDAGYANDTELIYPEELEEPISPTRSQGGLSRSSSSSSPSSNAESEIIQHLSRLDCADGSDTPLERRRRLIRRRKRTESRVFKRTHSQSVQGDAEMSDTDGMPDHDRSSSARRLRRRVRGPSGVHVVLEATPPPSRGNDDSAASGFRPSNLYESGGGLDSGSANDTMDVDEDPQ